MIDVGTVNAWTGVIAQLVGLGVSSFKVIKPAMQNAGLDDATILDLESKWDDLYNKVKAAAGEQ